MYKNAFLLPTFFPDLQFLSHVLNSEKTVLLDTFPYNRKSRAHRGLIKGADGAQWITLSIDPDQKHRALCDITIKKPEEWESLLFKKLQTNYGNSIYFDFYWPEIADAFHASLKLELFAKAAHSFSNELFELLELKPNLELLSHIDSSIISVDTLFSRFTPSNFLWESDSDRYLSRAFGASQLDRELPIYNQPFGDFIPNCCILDLLFNLGPESFKIVEQLLQ